MPTRTPKTAPHNGGDNRLPHGWRDALLGDVCEIQLGKMLSPKSKQGHRPLPYLRNANVQWERFDLDDVATMDFNEREETKFALRPGDLLVCEGGEPGRAAVWQGQIRPCYYQKALHRLRPIENAVDTQFLLYRLRLGGFTGEFLDQNAKTTIAHLPAVRLAKLTMALPEIPEQRRLAARLRQQLAAVTQACAAVQAQSEALDTLTHAVIRESLSNGNARPSRFADCLHEVTQGIGDDWRGYPVLGATRAGLAPAKEGVGKNPGRYKPVRPGTIFYNPMRILLGSIAMLDEGDKPGITSPDYVVMTAVPDRLSARWFYYWFRSRYGAEFIKSMTRGAVRERLMFKRLAPTTLLLPDWRRQQAADKQLAAITQAKARLADKLAALDHLPAALLREAFSGRF